MSSTWTQLGMVANVLIAVAYLAIAVSILRPLAQTNQLWRNRLGLSTGLIFFSCGVGHGIHAEHTIQGVVTEGWAHPDIDWHLGIWDGLTATFAIMYWRQRQIAGPPEDAGTLFNDLRRRQKELEAEAVEARLRMELAVERELAAQESFARAFDAAPNGIALVDPAGKLVRVNASFADIVGRDVESMSGLGLADLLVGEDEALVHQILAEQQAGEAIEVRLGVDGLSAWVRLVVTPMDAERSLLLVQLEDVTERRQAEERLNHLALHDPLTGLPNRLLFHDRATTALRQSERSATWTACLFIDLDHFKVVNDSLGHASGDLVLKAIAERLVAEMRPGDTVARMGGDEFCLLLPGLEDPLEAQVIATRVLTALDGFVEIDDLQVTTGASIGVAVVRPGERVSSQTLVRDADTALYRAKGNGRGHHVVFDEALRDDAERRLWVEAELRRGLQEGQIRVDYQPQWSLRTGGVVGFEALVRWDHPALGPLVPDDFLAVAVESGLVVEMGHQVLEAAVAKVGAWRETHPDIVLAVNLSSRQLRRPGFVDDVADLLRRSQVPPAALCLELTESDLTVLGRSALGTLESLRAIGVRLAVDDVGTGQSSLAHLVTLPIDIFKIDRTFVAQVQVPGAKRAVVEALLSLSRAIGVDVIAEGAETPEQVSVLRSLGCDIVQGFVFSRPISEAQADALLRNEPHVERVGAPID